MTNLYVKAGGWAYPNKVYAKVGTAWYPCKAVWRKHGATWIKHWPSPVDFSLNNTLVGMSAVQSKASGWSGGEFRIPAGAFAANTVPHLARIDPRITAEMHTAKKDGDPWGSKGIGYGGIYTSFTNTRGVYAGSPFYSGAASNGIVHSGNYSYPTLGGAAGITVPDGHVVTGIKWSNYNYIEDGEWKSGLNYQLLLSRLYYTGGVPVPLGDFTYGGGTQVAGAVGACFKCTGSWTSAGPTVPAGSTIAHVQIGYGMTRGSTGHIVYIVYRPTQIG